MALFVNPNRIVQYVLKEERDLPPDQQHVFSLKTLSHREWEERQDHSRMFFEGDATPRINTGAWIRWTLYFGLVGATGATPIPFRDDDEKRVSDAFLDHLHPSARIELSREIERISKLGFDDPKD